MATYPSALFKGAWTAIGRISPERLTTLRRFATIESIGSSTRTDGAKLSDKEVEQLLTGLEAKKFASRDEEEVAGYAETIETIFANWRNIPLTEKHIKQLHRDLLQYSSKDERHRGEYKTHTNHVEAFRPGGDSLGVVFETAPPFDTPRQFFRLLFPSPPHEIALCSASIGLSALFCLLATFRVRDSRR